MVATPETIHDTIETFRRAVESNARSAYRRGSLIELNSASGTDVIVAGDVHGHRLNYRRICQIADLAGHQRRHLVLQEVCHGGPTFPNSSGCMSFLLLEDIARLKVEFGDRVHFLMSNHELAELTDFPISKGNRILNMAFRAGLRDLYGDAADAVRDAQMEFIRSSPLAVRTSNGAFLCHSVPERFREEPFDGAIFERSLQASDFASGSSVFRLVWGRDYRESNIRAFAQAVGAQVIIQGHERTVEGARISDFHVVLDCCSDNATILRLPLDRELTTEVIQAGVIRIFNS